MHAIRRLFYVAALFAGLALPSAALAVGQSSFQVSPTITVQAAAYSAGYSEGGLITAAFGDMLNGPWTLSDFEIASAGGATNIVWVYGWSRAPSATCTDKATFVASALDNPYLLPGFPLKLTLGNAPGAWDTKTYASSLNLNLPAVTQDAAATRNAYFCIVTAGSVTPASTSDLSIVFTGSFPS